MNLADSEEERQRKKLRMQEDEEFYEKLCQEYSATSENNEAGKRFALCVARLSFQEKCSLKILHKFVLVFVYLINPFSEVIDWLFIAFMICTVSERGVR